MADYTLKDALTAANPSNIADALRQVDLGQVLLPIRREYVPTEASIEIKLDPPAASPAMFVAYVVVAGGDSGTYIATTGPFVAAGAGNIGACQMSADGTTVTFSGNILLATVCYWAASKTNLSVPFAFAAP